MKWFEGSIPEAIQLAKSKKALFIVFITGDDDGSRSMERAWEDDKVSQFSASNNCVGLKLDFKSQAGTQFAQIYPVMVTPSLFFIAPETGLPLEAVVSPLDSEQLLEKFGHVVQMHRSVSPSSVRQPDDGRRTDAVLLSSSSSSAARDDSALGATGGSDGRDVHLEDEDGDEDGKDEELLLNETLEERKERLLKKLAERRDAKAREREETEKKKELERRKLGQDQQKLRQWKMEMERKEIENSIKKEKEEQRRALEKVRADIERDRQEKAVRFKQEKEQREEVVQQFKKAKLDADAQKKEQENTSKRESTRIQFRLPDGSSVTQTFHSSESLSSARDFIQQRFNRPVGLSTTYPKRNFVDDDMSKTLLDLELAPSAVLIVLPEASGRSGHQAVRSGDEGGLAGIIWMLLAPLLALGGFIYNFLFPAPLPTAAHGGQDNRNANTRQPTSTNDGGAQPRQRSQGEGGLRNRRDGNINRLTADDEDDDAATWNGNSTQQM